LALPPPFALAIGAVHGQPKAMLRAHLHARHRHPRSAASSALGGARGFTLLELMVVVVLIGLLAVLAIPSMSAAALDRHVYEDAANIQDLIRESRARAMGRGGAVMIAMSTKSSQGSFRAYEMNTSVDGGGQNLPLTSCKAPSNWTDVANLRDVNDAMMDFTYEQSNHIKATLYGTDSKTAVDEAFLCFTPGGRTYYSKTASFDGDGTLSGALRVQVAHYDSSGSNAIGIVRQVLVPPSGAARVASGTP
jgi:type II secretion system protein H